MVYTPTQEEQDAAYLARGIQCDQLRAEIERLRAALQEIAEASMEYGITYRDIQSRARAALRVNEQSAVNNER